MCIYVYCVHRYRDINEDVDIAEQEAKHLEKLNKRIAERKSAYATKKKSDVITLRPQKPIEESKKELVQSIAEVPKKEQKEEDTQGGIKTYNTKPSHEFKVLGVNDFEKKTKVK